MEKIQIISIAVSLALFLIVFNLVRHKKMKTEYSLIWLLVSVFFIVLAIWRNGLELLAELFGVAYPPSVLFLVLIIGMLMLLIEFSLIISKQAEKIKTLVQELGLMRLEMEKRLDNIEKQIVNKHEEESKETK